MIGYQNMDLKMRDITKDGETYTVYVLPADKPIYRGDTRLYHDLNKPKGSPVKGDNATEANRFLKENNFFTLFPDEAEIYGVPYEYTKQNAEDEPFYLLAIDKHSKNKDFYNNAPKNIQIILNNNYGWNSKKRDSEVLKDEELSEYICKLGLDGYASQPMDSVEPRPPLPSEILICDSGKNLTLPNQAILTKPIETHISKYKTRLVANKRKRPTIVGSPPPPQKNRFINSGSPDSSNTGRNLSSMFGSPDSSNTGRNLSSMFGSPDSPDTGRNSSSMFGSLKQNNHAVPFAGFGPDTPTKGGKRTTKKRKTKRKINKKRKTIKKRKINKTNGNK